MDLYPWQRDAILRLQGKNGVLSAPTGSGKTLVAYHWAGLMDENGPITPPEGEKIIFTAPIKALSNERYLELAQLGFDVGIETGDFKKNPEAPVLCCTQEIYNLKYAGEPKLRVVIDEFHYIFEDNERGRAYIDGISRTHPDTPMLVMSATFGKSNVVQGYLEKIAQRTFELVVSNWRATTLTAKGEGLTLREIHDALVFVFSQRGTIQLADMIADERKDFDRARAARLKDLAWILGVDKIRRSMFKGVGIYHGSLLPKEKLFVERAYRERILDVVVGTDALALGVNLPAETVVFGQLVKFHDRLPLSKMAFTQMSGRAGRKGMYEEGYVSYLHDSPAESRGIDTGQIFDALLHTDLEDPCVSLKADYSALLKGERTIEQEAKHMAFYSLPERDLSSTRAEIRDTLHLLRRESEERCPHNPEAFEALLAELWYGEMNTEQNLAMAELYLYGSTPEEGYTHPTGLHAARALRPWERNDLQALLRVKRFNNNLSSQYTLTHMDKVDQAIVEIDSTVFGFEDKIDEMNATQPELPEKSVRLQSAKEKAARIKAIKRRKEKKGPKSTDQGKTPAAKRHKPHRRTNKRKKGKKRETRA